VALKLLYLVVRQLLAWARLSRHDEVGKDIEILGVDTVVNTPFASAVLGGRVGPSRGDERHSAGA